MQFKSGEWVTEPVVHQEKPAGQPSAQPDQKMVAVMPFIWKEVEQVKSFLRRSNQLSEQIQRTIYLLPIKGLKNEEVQIVAQTAFSRVEFILDSEGKNSDWQGREKIRDAAGPNSLFRQAAWWFYVKSKSPWLWLEPDCWPQTENWFYDLEREYQNAGKPFMGVKMEVPGGMQYMNGVGVYPWNAVQHSTSLISQTMWQQHPEYEVGFDVAGGKEVLQKAHITKKIQLVSHLARGDVSVRPETVLCHGRIDLSGGDNASMSGDEPARQADSSSSMSGLTAPKAPAPNFLDRYGVARDAQTAVFPDASPHAAPGVPAHETESTASPAQETILTSRVNQVVQEPLEELRNRWREANGYKPVQEPAKEYGRLSQDIKGTIAYLVKLWDKQPHRKVLIVKELRKAKLVPKHFR